MNSNPMDYDHVYLQNIPTRLCKIAETRIDYIISEQDFIKEIFVTNTLLGTNHQKVAAISCIRPNIKFDANLITIRVMPNYAEEGFLNF